MKFDPREHLLCRLDCPGPFGEKDRMIIFVEDNMAILQVQKAFHLLTVRGATLQIFATCPVVKTFIAGSPFFLFSLGRAGFRPDVRPGIWAGS